MSVINQTDCEQSSRAGSCAVIDTVIMPRPKDLGGFSVRRALPYKTRRSVGPFVFLDHMGPAQFAPGETGISVSPHPHIGLSTLTWLFDGRIIHRDSLGVTQAITPGDVNLMTAGRGIVHSERADPQDQAAGHTLDGLQFWLALPEEMAERDPAFEHRSASEIPAFTQGQVTGSVVMGSAFGVTSPVTTYSDTLLVMANLPAGAALELPLSEEIAVYVAQGSASVGATPLETYSLGTLKAGQSATVIAGDDGARIAIVGGKSLGERHMWWNFIATDKDRVRKAMADWEACKFPTVDHDPGEPATAPPMP